MTPAPRRFMPFVAVGAAGFAVQLASLHLLASYAGVHYLLATALAVEAAILHNFVWHSRWTWRDRPPQPGAARGHGCGGWRASTACRRFRPIAGNVAFTAVLVNTFGAPVVAANAIAVALVSALNFAGLDRWVFAAGPPRRSTRVPTAAVLAALSLSVPLDASAAELTAETRRAWQRHVAATEARIEQELRTPGRFLSLDFDAAGRSPAGACGAARRHRAGDQHAGRERRRCGRAGGHHPSLARRRVHSGRDGGRRAARRRRSHWYPRAPAGGRARSARALAVAECAAALPETATPGDRERGLQHRARCRISHAWIRPCQQPQRGHAESPRS